LTTFLGLILFYLVPVIGGVAIYLALPGGRRAGRLAPVILGAIAIGAMVGLLCQSLGHSRVAFYVLAVLAVIGAARVVTHAKPVYSAVYFLVVVLSVAGIAVLSGAEFLAAALVIIYAGAILVTYVFVIMLAQQSTPPEYDVQAREPVFAVLAGFVLVASLVGVMVSSQGVAANASAVAADTSSKGGTVIAEAPSTEKTWSNTLSLGTELMTTHVVAFEAAGVLLLVGIIGGIALATRRVPAASGGAE